VPRALIVDDNKINRSLLDGILRHLAWEPVLCESGEEALALLAAQVFDLVLLDLRMPGMSGTETCRRIRTELNLGGLPVVAYTAHGMLEDRERMLADGFSALLIKPVSVSDVRNICQQFMPGSP
jgi:CheY-like chemotaxis protein